MVVGFLALIGAQAPLMADHEVNLKRDRQLIKEAMDAADHYRFNVAENKLRSVREDIQDLQYSRDKNELQITLNLTIQKLNSRAGPREKANYVQTSGRIMLRTINELIDDSSGLGSGPLQRSIRRMDEVVELTEKGRDHQALDLLEDIEWTMKRFDHESDLDLAMGAVRRAQDVLRNKRLTPMEQVVVVRECARVFKVNVKDSRAYRLEVRGNDDVNLGQKVKLGETAHFSKSNLEVRRVRVGNDEGFFRYIRIRAEDDSLNIDRVVIVYGNGERDRFYGTTLREGQTVDYNLSGSSRWVESVEIMASSSIFWGTKAKAVVIGIR